MKRYFFCSMLVSVLGVGSLPACGGGAKSTTTSSRAAADDPSCPVTVPGTSVSVEDTDTGAALVFVTTGDAGEVRKRVAAMATMHNDHHGSMGALPDGKAASTGHEGHDMSKMGGGSSGQGGHDMSKMGSGSGGQGGHDGHDMSKMGSGAGGGHDMSKMGSGAGGGHDMSKHAGHAGGMIGVHSKAEAGDVDGGARLVFTSGAANVGKLQSELRMHAQHLSSGTCAMGGS